MYVCVCVCTHVYIEDLCIKLMYGHIWILNVHGLFTSVQAVSANLNSNQSTCSRVQSHVDVSVLLRHLYATALKRSLKVQGGLFQAEKRKEIKQAVGNSFWSC